MRIEDKIYSPDPIKVSPDEEERPIAWIEMKHYGDIGKAKQDLIELSNRVGFEITRFVTKKSSNLENRSKIIKAFTKTLEKIPENKLSIARKWLARENYWAQHVCKAKIEFGSENRC